jgi:hypothetical protein
MSAVRSGPRLATVGTRLLACLKMRTPRSLRLGVAVAMGSLALSTVACGSSDRRDQFYGTDTGTMYRPPEAGVPDAGADRPRDGGGGAGGGGDASNDQRSGDDR